MLAEDRIVYPEVGTGLRIDQGLELLITLSARQMFDNAYDLAIAVDLPSYEKTSHFNFSPASNPDAGSLSTG